MPDTNNPHNQEAPHQEQHSGTTDHGTGHGSDHAAGAENPFTAVLSHLGDHREITFGHIHLFDLPIILIDDGLHIYPSVHAMEAKGVHALEHHHVVNVATKKAPALDFSVTSLVFYQWVAMALLLAVFIPMGRKYKKVGVKPLGGIFAAMEMLIEYVRDEIVTPNIGKDGAKMLPIFLTFFFFILFMNYLGLIPGAHTATGSINVTAGLSIIAFFLVQIASINKIGIGGYLKHLTGGTPVFLWPIMIPVEILGLFTKPFALAIRLYANMVAGHVILLSLIALTFLSVAFIPVSVGFSLFIYMLELLVAFLQAYIFTTLTAVFTGMAMASHDHHEEHEVHSDRHATVSDVVTEMATGDYDDLSEELRKHQPAGAAAH